jgi:ferredoxin
VKLTLDSEACMGHGRCYSMAPELFDADAEGHSVLLSPEVPPGQEKQARDADQSCPENAIALEE